jgi:CheY-like chemotaxis protein
VLPVAEALVRRPDPPPAANRATPAECRILLLEDHLDTARALARLLSMEGHRVQTANTIAAAVAAMAAQPYDLLISDLQLPDGSGLDFMRQVRERFPVAGIALSGYGSATDVEQSLRAGFVEHLTKPVNIGQLNDAICRVRARQAGDVT